MKIRCAIVPLIKLSMAKVQRIEHEQRAQGTNIQLMHIKLNMIFFQYNIAETKILHNTIIIYQPSHGSNPEGHIK